MKKEIFNSAHNCQVGMYFSNKKMIDDNNYVIYSNYVKDNGWNYLALNHCSNLQNFISIYNCSKNIFNEINREPCVLIPEFCNLDDETNQHITNNFDLTSTTVTLLTDKFTIVKPLSKEYSFRRIDNKLEKGLFINTFKTSKTQVKEGDTYHALDPSYFDALESSFNNQTDWQFIHYISEFNNSPIGMISACVKGEFCGLYGGGTYVAQRGKGVFTNLLNYIYKDLNKIGVKYYFGITEAHSKNEKLYNSIGWNSLFYSKLYKPNPII